MNPNFDGRHFMIVAPGVLGRPSEKGRSTHDPLWFELSPADNRLIAPLENQSPYPGIHIGSGSELLDFRFEDTKILEGSDE